MKTKKIPALIMLIGGSVACLVTYVSGYNLEDMLIALVLALIVFYILGLVVEYLFEKFEIAKDPEEPEEMTDGEVVDKTGETEEDIETDETLNSEGTVPEGNN